MNYIVEQYLCMSGMADDNDSWWSLPFNGNNNNVDTNEDMCYHDWKDYNGFTEVYKYCTKCEAKHYGSNAAYYGSKKVVTKDEAQ